jgi:hypothetical protein
MLYHINFKYQNVPGIFIRNAQVLQVNERRIINLQKQSIIDTSSM